MSYYFPSKSLLACLISGSIICSAAGSLHAQSVVQPDEEEDTPYETLEVFASALQLIRQDFVDEESVRYRDLLYSALRGMLAELDPHSQFLEPSEFEGMQEDTKSEFGGLGAVVTIRNHVLTIVSPMEDSPVFKAGIQPGDQVVRINGKSTESMSLPEAIDLLRGKVGEKITLTIRDPRTEKVVDHVMVREVIKVPSVKGVQILPGGEGLPRVGYLRITQFSEPTSREVGEALDRLDEWGAEALILDLRFNPGGLLSSAVDVAGYFVPPGTEVVSTRGRVPGRGYETATDVSKVRDYPVVVLINYASASGSEVLAGALKDLGRAILLGDTTFGKGSVQSVVSLPDGSAIRLTTAKYFTPGEEVIHERGVEPHIKAPLSLEEETRILERRRFRSSELKEDEDIAIDPQLSRAIDVLQGLLIKKQAESRPDGSPTPNAKSP